MKGSFTVAEGDLAIASKCYKETIPFGVGEEAGPWLTIMLVFLVLDNLKGLICYADQYRIIRDENRVKKLYEVKVSEEYKELLTWEKVKESLAYNGATYKFLIIR